MSNVTTDEIWWRMMVEVPGSAPGRALGFDLHRRGSAPGRALGFDLHRRDLASSGSISRALSMYVSAFFA